ncbi:MAG: HlyD family efflux transporter periplasmic adaptor subunit [Saprospiraceae bacterium]|nr:HlyD family efflux transporter periplasmic adaptor subunit [Saprospiraceae bacterium]MCF8248678.1 HlyD family efflux transporter periplasmic adaptor subunit [Saprospiraceae bacterium]MCF8310632.1 HlyD family efflux transporter periplasmic adaptor subunit [Saprospiraceae bacterium]MCF8439191.1 HlyD family efflux transporter periplasmic adaptor subunit [Saprospiraceae bacterium]
MKGSFLILIVLASCKKEATHSDSYGNFEAVETIVSAEANGKLLFLKASEGEPLKANELVALVDTALLHLQKQQLIASLGTIGKKQQNPNPQIAILEEQQRNLVRERDRVQRLLADKAATPKQLDDLNGQIALVKVQIESARRQTGSLNTGILGEKDPVLAQIKVLNEQIRRCYIHNPLNGVVLTKIAEASEVVGFGSPLYKIAALDPLELRAFVSGEQLPSLKIGQTVSVLIDQSGGGVRSLPGTVSWISSKSEFTPKTIQTKEERVNLVYAFKVKVGNGDGALKIGMPGEVSWSNGAKPEKKQ